MDAAAVLLWNVAMYCVLKSGNICTGRLHHHDVATGDSFSLKHGHLALERMNSEAG